MIFGYISYNGGTWGLIIGGVYFGATYLYDNTEYYPLPSGWNDDNFAPPDNTIVSPPYKR